MRENVNDRSRYKRAFDLAILAVTHTLFLPLWVLVWTIVPVAIWLEDRGPVLYRRQSLGKDGVLFERLKFRTMCLGAEAAAGQPWTVLNDSRVTRVGRLLRRTGIDELPQVTVNILKGEMSFVGPRPLGIRMHEHGRATAPNFAARIKVTPGLTGLAQLYSDRIDPYQKLAYDRLYIRTMAPWLDLRLIGVSMWLAVLGRIDSQTPNLKRSTRKSPVGRMEGRIASGIRTAPIKS